MSGEDRTKQSYAKAPERDDAAGKQAAAPQRWRAENAAAIRAYNERVDSGSLLSDAESLWTKSD